MHQIPRGLPKWCPAHQKPNLGKSWKRDNQENLIVLTGVTLKILLISCEILEISKILLRIYTISTIRTIIGPGEINAGDRPPRYET